MNHPTWLFILHVIFCFQILLSASREVKCRCLKEKSNFGGFSVRHIRLRLYGLAPKKLTTLAVLFTRCKSRSLTWPLADTACVVLSKFSFRITPFSIDSSFHFHLIRTTVDTKCLTNSLLWRRLQPCCLLFCSLMFPDDHWSQSAVAIFSHLAVCTQTLRQRPAVCDASNQPTSGLDKHQSATDSVSPSMAARVRVGRHHPQGAICTAFHPKAPLVSSCSLCGHDGNGEKPASENKSPAMFLFRSSVKPADSN